MQSYNMDSCSLQKTDRDGWTDRQTMGAATMHLQQGWQSELLYLTQASLSPAAVRAPLMSKYFPNTRGDREGLYAVSEAHVYNPYHPEDLDPDLFTPQWRAKLRPVDVGELDAPVPGELRALESLIHH